jgi:uncharacterized SAM-binding protein YcdF (DUF218 family)
MTQLLTVLIDRPFAASAMGGSQKRECLMSWMITNIISSFLLPPLNIILLGAACMLLLKRNPRRGKQLIGILLVLLWVFSLSAVGNRLLKLLEEDAHTSVEQMHDAQAIVVLGAGTYNAPEYGGYTVNGATLERLRFAATLSRRTELPMLMAGGLPEGKRLPEAVLMKKVMEEEFLAPVRWVEAKSDNTRQSAVNCRELLASSKVHTIVLVTHSWHMTRAKRIFERAGFRVLPAGTVFHTVGKLSALSFLPNVEGMLNSATFFREAIGLLWYRLTPLK